MLNTKTCITLSIIAFALVVGGCKWRDDFRSRVHPQQQLQEPRATFNEDSEDYVGDEVAKGIPHDNKNVESIDELSDIPELPDSPN